MFILYSGRKGTTAEKGRGGDGGGVSIVLLNLAENYIHRATDDDDATGDKVTENIRIELNSSREIVDVYSAGGRRIICDRLYIRDQAPSCIIYTSRDRHPYLL